MNLDSAHDKMQNATLRKTEANKPSARHFSFNSSYCTLKSCIMLTCLVSVPWPSSWQIFLLLSRRFFGWKWLKPSYKNDSEISCCNTQHNSSIPSLPLEESSPWWNVLQMESRLQAFDPQSTLRSKSCQHPLAGESPQSSPSWALHSRLFLLQLGKQHARPLAWQQLLHWSVASGQTTSVNSCNNHSCKL
jgi:hypothetical protein